ncbi:MAG: F0F1 ATP synthase subunit A [Polyangiales bacterium]
MPHGESLFSFLPFYQALVHAAAALSAPVNHEGLTWVGHEPIGVTHVIIFAFVVLLLAIFGFMAYGQVKDASKAIVPEDKFTVRTFLELFVGFVYDQMAQMMGPKAAKYFLPLIGTCAFTIFFSNAIGLFPGMAPPTDNLNTTAAMAIVIFFATHIFGVKEHGLAYFKHFFGPVIWLAPLMFPIELISHIARPITLAVRLMANMTADHLVVAIFTSIVFIGVPVLVMGLGCIVVVVQTLVFCLLSTVYISMAIAHEGH